jgi:FMN phosphatase YigB (HAD superfamily)
MLKNIFLDVDGVILNRDKLENPSAEIITTIIKRYNQNYSITDYWNDIDEAVYRRAPDIYGYVLYKNIQSPFEFHARDLEFRREIRKVDNEFALTKGARNFLETFSAFYKIGMMGGDKYILPEFLKEKNLFQYITYNERPHNWFLYKPDIRYFEEILQKCNCKPHESIMIGDRIDEDIIPAMRMGMRTVRIKTGIYKGQEPRLPAEKANITVEKIDELTIEKMKTMDYAV